MTVLTPALRVALWSALIAGAAQLPPSQVFAQAPAAAASSAAVSVDALRARLQRLEIPAVADMGLDAPRSLTDRMVDAEMYFALREYVNCATLLAPSLAEPGFSSHPGADRARWLVAESLFMTSSYELARSQFQQIADANDPQYARNATMRLLEIAIVRRDLAGVERQYDALSSRWGSATDPEVDFVRGRARWFRGLTQDAVAIFERIPQDHAKYWKAQYHAAVAIARGGDLDRGMERLKAIEESLATSWRSHDDFEVLNLARLGQGIIYYEREDWDAAIEAYASVARNSSAFEQALYQVAWTMIREERYGDAIESLEILALISQNTKLISDARLIAAEMRRRTDDHDGSLAAYEQVWSDFELMRNQLREISFEEGSAAQRLDATTDILTGTVLAEFDYEHWLTKDQTTRAAVALVREADQLGLWLADNQEISKEIREALESGFAYDRVQALRSARQEVIEIVDDAAKLRMQALDASLASHAGAPEAWAAQRARDEYLGQPKTFAQMDASITRARDSLNEKILEIYREEQRLAMQLDNLRASDSMVRDRLRMQLDSVESVQAQRAELRRQRTDVLRSQATLKEVREALQRRRVRYGIGESQSQVLRAHEALRLRSDALLELTGGAGAELASLRQLEQEISATLQRLDQGVGVAWTTAWNRLQQEERALGTLNAQYTGQRSGGLQDAERTAMEGYHGMIAAVEDVSLRASLGQVDVAWWQKEVVSRRIDALFRERERQIERLDADFSEIRD